MPEMELFDDHEEEDHGMDFKINPSYAKSFEFKKKKEELTLCKFLNDFSKRVYDDVLSHILILVIYIVLMQMIN